MTDVRAIVRVIEFVGPSGAGKSTLFESVLAARKRSAQWRSFEEIRRGMSLELSERLERKEARHGQGRRWRRRAAPASVGPSEHDLVVARYERRAWQEALSPGSAFSTVFDRWIDSLARPDKSALERWNSIDFLYRRRMTEFVVLHFLNPPVTGVHHDGLFHNAGLDEQTSKRLRPGDGVVPDAAVVLHISVDENFRRREKRVAAGQPTYLERGKTPDELYALCERSHARAAVKRRILDRLGVPLTHIDAEDDPTVNVRRCLEALDTFTASWSN